MSAQPPVAPGQHERSRDVASCPREVELLTALGRGFLAPDLAAHVQQCACCSELHLVAGALLDERTTAVAEAPVPSAGSIWWRLQMRHRREAQATARRTLLVGQAVTLGVAMVLLLTLFGSEVVHAVRHVVAAVRLSTPLLLALVTLLLLAPIGGWLATRQK
jgi:VIT1/CCC1 family predicted Fe2+/Mn2+ transporter